MWQFWQRGCWRTWRTVSKAARPAVASVGAAAWSRAATPQHESGRDEPDGGPHASLSGSRRSLWPVAAKTAFATAGAIGGTPGSPTPLGRLGARHDVHLDDRHLEEAQGPVVVEVRLLHAAFAERDLAVERGGEAEHDRGLDLRRHARGVHRRAAVDRADDAVHADAALVRPRPPPPGRRSCRTTRARPARGSGRAAAACPSPPWPRPGSSTPRCRGCLRQAGRGDRRADPAPPPARARRSASPSRTPCASGRPSATTAWSRATSARAARRGGSARPRGTASRTTPSTAVGSTPFFTIPSNGVPIRNDWPTSVCCQATGAPVASRPTFTLWKNCGR